MGWAVDVKGLDPGRAWAYVGAVIGGGVSVAANVAHSYVRPDAGWPNHGAGPEPGAVGFAIFWPAALLVAVEIFSRTTWRAGWQWSWLRYGGLLPLAGVAAFVSYRHLSGLLTHYGEEPITQYVGPLAVDGLMLLATSALLATAAVRQVPVEVGATLEEKPRTTTPALPAATPGPSIPSSGASPAAAASGGGASGRSGGRPDISDLLLPGQASWSKLPAASRTYKAFADQFKADGHRAGTERLKELFRVVRDRQTIAA